MFYIACKNGFVKDYNGRLIYTADIRTAKPFVDWDDAEEFAERSALASYYCAILSSLE
jgi:hypothetical protein